MVINCLVASSSVEVPKGQMPHPFFKPFYSVLSGPEMDELVNIWISVDLFYRVLSGSVTVLGEWLHCSFSIIWHIMIQNIPEASFARSVSIIPTYPHFCCPLYFVIGGHTLVNVKWEEGFWLFFFFSFHSTWPSLCVFKLREPFQIERVQT